MFVIALSAIPKIPEKLKPEEHKEEKYEKKSDIKPEENKEEKASEKPEEKN